jgi:hypothetical protein
MISHDATAALVTVAAEVRACEREIVDTERHLSQIADDTRRTIAASRRTRPSAEKFPLVLVSAAALTWATAAITSRRRW